MPSIYIINPASSFPSYHTAEFFEEGGRQWVQVADLTVATVAALVPEGWDIRITEEEVSPVDLDADVDFVALTGKVSQRNRMVELAREFRRRGRVVIIGGSFASLTADDIRPHADILVTGELEEMAQSLFADLAAGTWRDRYDCGKADIRLSPLPRWDLYPVDRALMGALQTTRGCPFDCEFCDVIQYQGRKQRHKTIEQVLAELDHLYSFGFRQVFLVDDNFTVHRQWAHAALDALAEWNARHANDPVGFLTQASLDIARDDELMRKCHAAGLRTLFVGIETINERSLRETRKKQNLLMPMLDAIRKILRNGISIQAGIIVGFDHDDQSTFGDLLDFFQNAPLPELTIGALSAPRSTDLHRRLAAAGRLVGEVWDAAAASPFATNIVPAQMTRAELLAGVERLCHTVYSAAQYERRVLNLIDSYGGHATTASAKGGAATSDRAKLFFQVVRKISALGPDEAAMVANVLRSASRKPGVLPTVMYFLSRYGQTRYFLDLARREQQAAPREQQLAMV